MSIILGVLGARNAITKQIMQDEILGPILDDLEKPPTKILLPAEPLSSTYIECWAGRQDIPVELIKSDWGRDGRRAGVVRDYRIEKESTAFLVFEGPKSRYYLDLAERIAKKARRCEGLHCKCEFSHTDSSGGRPNSAAKCIREGGERYSHSS